MSEYPFRYEKHPKKKGVCPNCGQKDQFRFYEDSSGNRVGDLFGKCERVNNCGYQKAPPLSQNTITNNIVFEIADNQVVIFPNEDWSSKFEKWEQNCSSNLHQFWMAHGIPQEHFEKHGVATDNQGKTVFILRNIENRIMNAKWFSYDVDGHRVKRKNSANSYSMTQPKGDKTKYGMCLYGENLLDPAKTKTVVVVESEKTKVVASFYYPEFDWVACGANNGLTDDKISVLFGRKVIWLCDADIAGRDNSSIKKLKSYQMNFQVVDLFPDREDGYDLADAIEEGLRPNILDVMYIIISKDSDENSGTMRQENGTNEFILKNSSVQYRKDTSIWIKTRNNWEVVADNFHIFIKYFTDDENEQYTWIIELKVANREPIFIEIAHEDFCSAKKMKTILASKRLSFKANDNHISELHSLLFKTKFGTATKITRFGFHRDSSTYFFSNRALTPDGLVVEPDKFGIIQSLEHCLSMPLANTKMKRRFLLTDNDITFNQWFTVYVQAHTLDKTFIPACFYIMSLFRDIMVTHKGSSPILYLKGGYSTGKSSIVKHLTCLFGFEPEPINLVTKNTEAALVKLMSQTANGMIWMDEFHNGFEHEGLLQAAYDNAGYHKTPDSSKSNTETDSIEIHSALALTSNFIPGNSIFFSRCLLIQVESKEKSQDQKIGYQKLKQLETQGLACITVELLQYRPLILSNYNTTFNKLSERISIEFKSESIPERLFSNMVQTLTCAYILQCNGKIAICESIDEEDILDDFVEMGVATIRKQFQIQNETSVLAEFFEILQMLYETYQIHEGVHFRLDGEYLYLRMPSIYPIFKQRYRNVHYKDSPDKDSIIQEVLRMEEPRGMKEVVKTIRFRGEDNDHEDKMKNAVTNSLSLKYDIYCSKFSLDLNNRTQRESI
jgi:hypothetical protein